MSETETRTEVSSDAFDALRALGEAWRGDWSEFDGRTLRSQLDDWMRNVTAPDRDLGHFIDWETWLRSNDICPTCQSWTEHCICKGIVHD